MFLRRNAQSLSALVLLLVGVLLPIALQPWTSSISKTTASVIYAACFVLIVIAIALGRHAQKNDQPRHGGKGGDADASGEGSEATGGPGGNRGFG
jgi:hypothetical protein